MKAPFDPLHLLFPLALTLGACGGSGTGEPNDSKARSAVLKSGQAIKMKLDSAGDKDWYGIVPSGKGYVEVTLDNTPGALNPEIGFDNRNAWQRSPAAARVQEEDTLYFAVRNADKTMRSKKSFSLEAEFLKEMDPHEPNDTLPQAEKIESGKKMTSYVIPKGDRDLFQIKVDRSGYLFAKVKAHPDTVGPEVRFLEKGKEGGLIPISGYRVMPAGAAVNDPGSYYIEVGDDHNDAWSKKAIQWEAQFIAQMDSTEPNAKRRDAHPISTTDTLKIALFPQGDRDLFRFTPERSRRIAISAEGAKGIKPQVQVVQGAVSNRNITRWETLPGYFKVKKGKEYFMTLRLKGDGDGSRSPFLLRLGDAPSS